MAIDENISSYLINDIDESVEDDLIENMKNVRNVHSRISSTCEIKVSWGMLEAEIVGVSNEKWKR